MRRASLLLITLLPMMLSAHPQPDIPVKVSFAANQQMKLAIELDPRCWASDPDTEPYFTKEALEKLAMPDRQALLERAKAYHAASLRVLLQPGEPLTQGFDYRFTTLEGKALSAATDPAVITATWSGDLPAAAKVFRLEAPKESKMAVPFHYFYNDQPLARFGVLFPGELSYELDLTKLDTAKLAEP
jgi:hypothetical protein